MTTAHRPTFEPARGGGGRNEGDLSKLSQQYSSKDMPSHKTLKYRQVGQAHPEELKHKDLRRELEDRERSTKDKDKDRDRRRIDRESEVSSALKKMRVEPQPVANADADDPLDEIESDEDDDDDEAELMAELERIKKERAAEREKIDEKEREERERIRQENILYGNPLLNPDAQADFKVKRRWDDDVVFKNCAKGIDERKKQPSFVNDAIRSEFHKKFMEKYIK